MQVFNQQLPKESSLWIMYILPQLNTKKGNIFLAPREFWFSSVWKTTGPLTKSPKKSAASLPALLNEYSCSFPHAAFEKSFFFQSGDVAVNSADADLIRCQIFGNLPRAYLLVCMLGKIFQKPLALPRQIFAIPYASNLQSIRKLLYRAMIPLSICELVAN